jgi:hypothetical protein
MKISNAHKFIPGRCLERTPSHTEHSACVYFDRRGEYEVEAHELQGLHSGADELASISPISTENGSLARAIMSPLLVLIIYAMVEVATKSYLLVDVLVS